MRTSGRSWEESAKIIAKLESRVRQQRHVITDLQGRRAAQNARFTGWWEGREAMLKEQLREQRKINDNLVKEIERLKILVKPQ